MALALSLSLKGVKLRLLPHTRYGQGSLVRNLNVGYSSEDSIDRTIVDLAKDLENLKLDYAIVGGNALKVHGFKRFTTDVDVLLAKGGRQVFSQKLVGRGYAPRFEKAKSKFRNTVFNVNIDLLEAGDFPGDGKPNEIAFPDPKEHSFTITGSFGVIIRYLNLLTLIQLKLASYQSLPSSRERDKLDVVELLKVSHLDESYASKLHPVVRNTFVECYRRAKQEQKEEASEY